MCRQTQILILFGFLIFLIGCSVTDPQRELTHNTNGTHATITTGQSETHIRKSTPQTNEIIVSDQRFKASTDNPGSGPVANQQGAIINGQMEEFAIASKDVDAIYPIIPNRSAS